MQKLGQACGEYLAKKVETRPDLWVIDGDLADSNGADKFAEVAPEKFIQGGIAEQNMISIAAGLASVSSRPWVFSFAAFLCFRAYDQIRVGISQSRLPVTLVGSHSGGCGGRNGKTHLAFNDISVMSSLPNIHIWAPADPQETESVVEKVLNHHSPAYIRLPRDPLPMIPGKDLEKDVRWIGKPANVALISYGLSTHWALEAQNLLKKIGYDIGVLHFSKVWPISDDVITSLLAGVDHAFVLEDHYAQGGLGSSLKLRGFRGNVINWCWPDSWSGQSGETFTLLDHCKRTPGHLCEKVADLLNQLKLKTL